VLPVYNGRGRGTVSFISSVPHIFSRLPPHFAPQTILISIYKCKLGGTWSVTDWQCFGPAHMTMMVVVSLLLPCFWAFTLCVSAVFFDREYSSDNITSRPHGRVAIAMISIKTGLTLLFTVASDADPWFLHVLVLACGVVWLYLFLRYLPMFNQRINRTWSAFAAVFTWAAICAILAKVLADPKSNVAAFVFFIGAPTAAFAGYALAFMQYNRQAVYVQHLRHMLETRIGLEYEEEEEAAAAAAAAEAGGEPGGGAGAGGGRPSGFSRSRSLFGMAHPPASPFDVELRVRFLLEDMIATARAAEGGHGGHGHGSGVVRVSAVLQQQGAAQEAIRRSGSSRVRAAAGAAAGSGDAGKGRSASVVSASVAPTPASHGGGGVGDGPAGGESDAPSIPLPLAIKLCLRLYEEAGKSLFPTSGLLALFHANFIRCFIGDHNQELAVINDGLQRDAGIDIRFLLLQAKRQLEEGAAGDPAVLLAVTAGKGAAAGGGHAAAGGHGHGGHGGHGHGHGGKMSIIERVQYEQWMAEAIDSGMVARNRELEFWSELRQPAPSLPSLHRCSEEMSTAINRASGAFAKLLALRPDSVEVLQTYAVFLLEVKRETALANKYFDKSDDILGLHHSALSDPHAAQQLQLQQPHAGHAGQGAHHGHAPHATHASQHGSVAGSAHHAASALPEPAAGVGAARRGSRSLSPAGPGHHPPQPHASAAHAFPLSGPHAPPHGGPAGARQGAWGAAALSPLGGEPSNPIPSSPSQRHGGEAGAGGPLGGSRRASLQPPQGMGDLLIFPAGPSPSPTLSRHHTPTSRGGSVSRNGGGPASSPHAAQQGSHHLSPVSRDQHHLSPAHRLSPAHSSPHHRHPPPMHHSLSPAHHSVGVARHPSVAGSAGGAGAGAVGAGDDPLAVGGSKNRRGSAAMATYAASLSRLRRSSTVQSTAGGSSDIPSKQPTLAVRSPSMAGAGGGGFGRQHSDVPSKAPGMPRGGPGAGSRSGGHRASSEPADHPRQQHGRGRAPPAAAEASAPSRHGAAAGEASTRGEARGAAEPSAAVGVGRTSISRRELASIIRGQVGDGSDSSPSAEEDGAGAERHASGHAGAGRSRSHGDSARGRRPLSARAPAPLSEEEELFTARETVRTVRLQALAVARKDEARRRKADEAEAAASSLKLAIRQQARAMEPALVRLFWVLTALFALAGVLTVVMLAVERALVASYTDTSALVLTATQRQRAIEVAVDASRMLTRFGDGRFNVSLPEANATAVALAAAGKVIEDSHRALYLSASGTGSLPAEGSLYSSAVWVVRDYTQAGADAVARSGTDDGLAVGVGAGFPITVRNVSLANLGVEFASKATLLAAVYPLNVTSANMAAAWILYNGPAAFRPAANLSAALLGGRLEAMEGNIALVTLVLSALNIGLFTAGFALVLLPVLAAVKRSSDDVFRVFLRVPDPVLEEIQSSCRQQIRMLTALAEEGAAEEDALLLHFQQTHGGDGSGQQRDGSGRSSDRGTLELLQDESEVVPLVSAREAGDGEAADGDGRRGRGSGRRPHSGHRGAEGKPRAGAGPAEPSGGSPRARRHVTVQLAPAGDDAAVVLVGGDSGVEGGSPVDSPTASSAENEADEGEAGGDTLAPLPQRQRRPAKGSRANLRTVRSGGALGERAGAYDDDDESEEAAEARERARQQLSRKHSAGHAAMLASVRRQDMRAAGGGSGLFGMRVVGGGDPMLSARSAAALSGAVRRELVRKISSSLLAGSGGSFYAPRPSQETPSAASSYAATTPASTANLTGRSSALTGSALVAVDSFSAPAAAAAAGGETVRGVSTGPSVRSIGAASVPALDVARTMIIGRGQQPTGQGGTPGAVAGGILPAAAASPSDPLKPPAKRRSRGCCAGCRKYCCCCCSGAGAMTLRLLARFVWPFLLLSAFYAAMWGFEAAAVQAAARHRASTALFGSLRIALWEVHTAFTAAAYEVPGTAMAFSASSTSNGTAGGWALPRNVSGFTACWQPALAVAEAAIGQQVDAVSLLQDALVFGGASTASSGVYLSGIPAYLESVMVGSDWLVHALLKDACGLPSVPAQCRGPAATAGSASAAATPGFFNGLLGNGLQASLREYGMYLKRALQQQGYTVARMQGSAPAQALLVAAASPALSPYNSSGQLMAALDAYVCPLPWLDVPLARGASGYGLGYASPATAPTSADGLPSPADYTASTSGSIAANGDGSAVLASELRKLFLWYLDPALGDVQTYLQGLLVASDITVYAAAITGGAVLLLLTLALCWYYLTRVALAKMDGDVKRTRSVLLLFPTDVLADVAEYLQAAHSGAVAGMLLGGSEEGDLEGEEEEAAQAQRDQAWAERQLSRAPAARQQGRAPQRGPAPVAAVERGSVARVSQGAATRYAYRG